MSWAAPDTKVDGSIHQLGTKDVQIMLTHMCIGRGHAHVAVHPLVHA